MFNRSYIKYIENDFNQLKDKGVKIISSEPQPCPPGRYFVIEDPSGNQIEIVEFSNQTVTDKE